MSLILLISNSIACPQTELHPVGIDPYVIQVGEKELSLVMEAGEEALSSKSVVAEWYQILDSCNKDVPIAKFNNFVRNSDHLYEVGKEYSMLPFWTIRKKIDLRKIIREKERTTALSYAYFLESLQQETGIAVTWDPTAHPLAQGMISTARGSEFVADYIILMWE
jgi:hypothetical protein